MKKIYYLLFILLLSQSVALAQRENYNWHFGRKSVVEFNTGGPVAKTTTSLISYEACSSISDGAGQLLFYSNSEKVWNRNHALMPNGAALSSSGTSSTQGALIVPHPGNPALYYIFLTDESERKLEAGFRYAVVDMRLANGLGDLTGPAVRLPTSTLTGKVAEKLTAIRHADGRGYWVLVHAWGSNNFYSFLLTAAGISATPVVSAVGPVLNDDNTPVPYANAIGYLRASPDGLHLAMACRDRDLELYDFDPATGIASNFVSLPTGVSTQPNRYGLEFSPDGSRLYSGVSASDLSFSLLQYDMNAGGGAAIASSRQVVGTGRSGTGALLLAPDGKIYMAAGNYLHAINQPNNLGSSCDFKLNALSLNGGNTIYNLPNFPNAYGKTAAVQFSAPAVCVGAQASFSAQITVPSAGAVANWNFGDSKSGANNLASGLKVAHTYTTPGSYTVTL